ncbi:hypothetical protein Pint_27305 [Pistacia integerrima]|uniref:Uncharacterized protein n=1 Tax=Pistacia integerrima TaxID=434235 RepID=A0ACC0YU32_9ROSI|nr:hypothetical protein Pint_27305 [Pistacia integerrima]
MEEVAEEAADVSQLFNGLFKILGSWELRDFALQLVRGVDSQLEKLNTELKMVGFLLRVAEENQLKKDGGASFHSARFDVQTGSKIKEMSNRLEPLRRRRSGERELEGISGGTTIGASRKHRGKVPSASAEQGVYVKFYLTALVGMGGVGKMKIVRELYWDRKAVEVFEVEKKAWVCISDNFDVLTISKVFL